MFTTVRTFIEQQNLIPPHATIIIGLSGGPDSVCLLHILSELRAHIPFTVIAAHLNHEWRANAHEDETLCAQLCNTLQVPLIIKRAHELSFTPKHTGSQEDHGRQLRRHFFAQLAQEYCEPVRIALAHHTDDQIETFFIRLARGTTLTGLTGMQAHDGLYIRPLLSVDKNTILTYLTQNNLPYCVDPTNTSMEFLRNRIRHTLIPALGACDKRLPTQIIRTMKHLADTEQFLDTLTRDYAKTVTTIEENSYALHSKKLLELDPFIQKRIIVWWLYAHRMPGTVTEKFVDEILRFLKQSRGGTHVIHPHWSIAKKKGIARVARPE